MIYIYICSHQTWEPAAKSNFGASGTLGPVTLGPVTLKSTFEKIHVESTPQKYYNMIYNMKLRTVEQWNSGTYCDSATAAAKQLLLTVTCNRWRYQGTGCLWKKDVDCSKISFRKVMQCSNNGCPIAFLAFLAILVSLSVAKTIQCRQACGVCWCNKAAHSKAQIGRAYWCPSLVPHDESKQQNHIVKIWNSETTNSEQRKQWNQTWSAVYCAPVHPWK